MYAPIGGAYETDAGMMVNLYVWVNLTNTGILTKKSRHDEISVDTDTFVQ